MLHNTTKSLNETLATAEKIACDYGITRTADVTQFSNVNLPVWVSLRPNAKCLSQSAGKGLCSDSAKVSAIMEGIEIAISEDVDKPQEGDTFMTLDEAASSKIKTTDVYDYPLQPCLAKDERIPWRLAYDIRTGDRILVPVGMLSLDFTLESNNSVRPRKFRTTSNGLASGTNRIEAQVSASLEVVERHSITLQHMIGRKLKRLYVDGVETNHLAKSLDELAKNNVQVQLYEATVIEGLHTVEAFLWSQQGTVPPVHGFGCSLNLETAILRAVLEANQASTLLLSGSRDDLTKQTFLITADAEKINTAYQEKTISSRQAKRTDFYNLEITPSEELGIICDKIYNYCGQDIISFDYTCMSSPVSVCKVMIPTLEGYFTAGYKSPRGRTNVSRNELDSCFSLAAGGNA